MKLWSRSIVSLLSSVSRFGRSVYRRGSGWLGLLLTLGRLDEERRKTRGKGPGRAPLRQTCYDIPSYYYYYTNDLACSIASQPARITTNTGLPAS